MVQKMPFPLKIPLEENVPEKIFLKTCRNFPEKKKKL
jgi:hypothetical protein